MVDQHLCWRCMQLPQPEGAGRLSLCDDHIREAVAQCFSGERGAYNNSEDDAA